MTIKYAEVEYQLDVAVVKGRVRVILEGVKRIREIQGTCIGVICFKRNFFVAIRVHYYERMKDMNYLSGCAILGLYMEYSSIREKIQSKQGSS